MTDALATSTSVSLTATRAASFLDSLGVNTHLSWWDTAWGVGNGQWAGAETKVIAELQYLNVTNIRDALPSAGAIAEMTDLAKDGYKFDLVQNVTNGQVNIATDISTLASLQAAAPGAVASYEGANEYNVNSYTLNGQNSNNNLAWGALDDQLTQAAIKGNAALSGMTYVAASTASVSAAPNVASYVDASNWHVYGGVGQQLKAGLATCISAAGATASGKPVYVTETGVSSAAVSQSTWGTAGDDYTQGLIITNATLDAFHDGASKTFLYDLMDNNKAADLEDNFGLFNADGTAKPVATDLHNLTTILADTAASARTFATTALNVQLTNLPTTASDMLLEKASGTYDLVLWNSGATVWNTSTNAEATPATATVGIQLDGIHQTVKVYDPLVSATAVQTYSNVSSISVGLSKDPLIVELSPGTVPAVPAATKIGTGTHTLIMQMSEDAYNGDAQFTISVDGTQVGGTQTVVASHTAGQSQEFDVAGNWTAGTHTVSVNFLNDACGGTATTDRNLYDNSATFDGKTVLSSPISQLSNGAAGFSFTSGTELDLSVNEDAYNGDAQFTVSVDGTQVGGTNTATASHSAGATQKLALYGTWGTGAHTVSVNFLNDAWGGTAATDRNLYVTAASFGGKAVSGAALSLMSAGVQSFVVPATATTSTAATKVSATAAHSGSVTTYNLTDGLAHSVTTAAAATDLIKLGSGAATVTTHGTDTIQAGSGSSTISAMSGSLSFIGGSGSTVFTQGAATSNLQLGGGKALVDLVKDISGGSLTISGFVGGTDLLHLSGYAGTGIKSEQIVGGSTQILLTDNTQISLHNFVPHYNQSLFT